MFGWLSVEYDQYMIDIGLFNCCYDTWAKCLFKIILIKDNKIVLFL